MTSVEFVNLSSSLMDEVVDLSVSSMLLPLGDLLTIGLLLSGFKLAFSISGNRKAGGISILREVY